MSTVTIGFQVMKQVVNKNGLRVPKAVSRLFHVRSAAEEHCRMWREQADRDRSGRKFHVSEVQREIHDPGGIT